MTLFSRRVALCKLEKVICSGFLLMGISSSVLAQEGVNPGAVLERIAPLFSGTMPSSHVLKLIDPPAAPQPVSVGSRLLDASGTPLISDALWNSLPVPGSASLQWISAQLPGINVSQIHLMSFSDMSAIALAALKQKENSVSLLTDAGLTTPHIYYVPREVLAQIFSTYQLNAITVYSGTSKAGQKFEMQGMLIGNNQVQALYNLNNFSFINAQYPDHPFVLDRLVTFKIKGPGDMGVTGIHVEYGILRPEIREIKDLRNGYLQVITNHGPRNEKSDPISFNINHSLVGSR